MKKLICCLLTAAMLLTGCAGSAGEDKKLTIITSIYPVYDWVLNILGDRVGEAQVILLQQSGADLHSYQTTAKDMVTISSGDIFFYIGGESDSWVEEALAKNGGRGCSLMTLLGSGVREEVTPEGAEHDHDHEHEDEHDHEHEEDHDHGPEYDEHIWLSLRNAQVLVTAMAQELAAIDPSHADSYRSNADAYCEKLKALDEQYVQMVSEAGGSRLLFGDRFPFRYLAEDLGLTCYAAFPGCSAETEASFETVIRLAQLADQWDIGTILTIDGSDGKLAKTIGENTASGSRNILELDSLQSAAGRGENGYLKAMEHNLSVLREALG